MPLNLVDGLGYMVNGDVLTSADCKVAWERVEKIWGRGGNKVPQFFNVVLSKKTVEQQRVDPSLPQHYQSRASKTEALAGSVFKTLVPKLKDRMPDPFASVQSLANQKFSLVPSAQVSLGQKNFVRHPRRL